MVEIKQLLAEARAAGVGIRADGDRLVIETPRREMGRAEELGRRKWEVLSLLAEDTPEVTSRVRAMRLRHDGQAPAAFLTVRDVPRGRGGCQSCGEPLVPFADGLAVRCAACRNAAWLVLSDQTSAPGERPD